MIVRSLHEMLMEYGILNLAPDDQEQRDEMLLNHNYSVIVEGEFSEQENLNKWIKINIGIDSISDLYYGKTDYDYGFAEFFFNEENHLKRLIQAVPNIFTIYPHSYPPNHICKTDGRTIIVDYNSTDIDAIIFLAG